jgi:ligand-binding sensor domain-containing protein
MKKSIQILAMCLLSITGISQIVTTVVDDITTKFTDALIFDASNNLYCADYSGSSVYKRTPDGTVTTFASGMNTPNGMAFDSEGNMFICDNIGNAIYKISSTGIFLDTFFTPYPSGIIKQMDSDTMIFTEYSAQNTIRKLAPDGTITSYLFGAPLDGPVGLAYCNGELYIANFNGRKIFRVENDQIVYVATVPGPSNGFLGFITSTQNKLYGTSWNSHKIYEIDPNFIDSTRLLAGTTQGSIDGSVDTAKFAQPNGIIANFTGDTIYVSQYSSGKLRMITNLTAELEQITFNPPLLQFKPNPFQNSLSITNTSTHSIQTISIYYSDGKLAKEFRNLNIMQTNLLLSDISKGNLIVKIEFSNGLTSTYKLLKE